MSKKTLFIVNVICVIVNALMVAFNLYVKNHPMVVFSAITGLYCSIIAEILWKQIKAEKK